MNPAEIALGINFALMETTIASTAALLLVLLMRRRVRTTFGASMAYAAWLLVPISTIAVLLPAPAGDAVSIPAVYRFVAQPMQAVVTGAELGIHVAELLFGAWLLGAMAMVMHFIFLQRRFRTSLGRLFVREADVLQADAIAGLPAAVGVFHPVIVLPVDFETRYTVEQRALMLDHERAHIRHGDLQANAAFLALRCLFWFNPLLHFASRAFRHDQELACDQRVIARHPTSRRAYGEAMFKTQLATQALPLGCHWGFTHPLKERIQMLSTSSPSRARRIVGSSILTASVLFVGSAAWAAQPRQAHDFGLTSNATPSADQVKSPPVYPDEVLAKGIGGMVVLVVDVAADGAVINAVVDRSSNNSELDAAAMDAVKSWKFLPAIKDGKAVASKSRVPIEFSPDSASNKKKS
ncbi:MAG: TonB family protein [Pseudomonadota bacterium]|nr:TonB family protein [Pseudomonadota bacterium]